MRVAMMSHGHYALIGKLYPAYLEKMETLKMEADLFGSSKRPLLAVYCPL
jgi:hypothetical protein